MAKNFRETFVENIRVLPPRISRETGYKKGVFIFSDKTHAHPGATCTTAGCGCVTAKTFESRIIAVLEKGGARIPLENLPEDIIGILQKTNATITQCLPHLFLTIAQATSRIDLKKE